ncbi:hypothetical protein [Oxynema aestuarii]|uniref:hypothetical protein n=1 Tax=Oxynema aestuarii TaxID=2874213 RepID=UPI001B30F886|nr:hypothetical protein [Oxynema aestuarii]
MPQLLWRRLSTEDNGDRRVTYGSFEGRSPNCQLQYHQPRSPRSGQFTPSP